MSDPLCPTPPAVVCSADPSVCVCEDKGNAFSVGAGADGGESATTPAVVAASVALTGAAVGVALWRSRRSSAAVSYNSAEDAIAGSSGQSNPLMRVVPVETPAAEAPAGPAANTAASLDGHGLIVALLTDPENPGREGEPGLLRTWDKDGNPTVEFLDGTNGLPAVFDGKEYVRAGGLLIEANEAAEVGMAARLDGIDWQRGGMSVFEGGKGYVEFNGIRMLESEYAGIAVELAAANALGTGRPGTISFGGYPIETSDPRRGELVSLNPSEQEIHAEAEAAITEKFPDLKPEERRAYVKVFERYEEAIWNEGLKEASGIEITPEQFVEMRRVHVQLLAAEFTGRGFKGEFIGMDPSYRFGSTAAYVLSGGEAKGVSFEGLASTAMRALNERRNAAMGIESRERRGAEKDRAREARPMELLRGVK